MVISLNLNADLVLKLKNTLLKLSTVSTKCFYKATAFISGKDF